MTFPETLATYRCRAGMSASQLARKAGVNPSLISRYESAERGPDPSTVSAIADALGLDTADTARLLMSAGYVPFTVRRDPALIDAIATVIVQHQPRSRTATVERRTA